MVCSEYYVFEKSTEALSLFRKHQSESVSLLMADAVTSACKDTRDRRVSAKLVPTFADRRVSHVQCGRSPTALISVF
jgi:hypothetical protein